MRLERLPITMDSTLKKFCVGSVKTISLACLLIEMLCLIGDYPAWYYMGYRAHTIWTVFNPFNEIPLALIIFPLLTITWIISLCIQKARIWTTATVFGVIFSIALFHLLLPPPGSLLVYGIRDHVMKTCSRDDLRRFAKAIHADVPEIDVARIDPAALPKDQSDSYRKMKVTYPFLNWGPNIRDEEGVVTVSWGGALTGQWGFSVSIDGSKINPYADPLTSVIRMSDDIYFFAGD